MGEPPGERAAAGAGAVVAGLGILMTGVHLLHGLEEIQAGASAFVYGAVLPAIVSLLILASGYRIARRGWSATTPWRVVGWFVAGVAVGVILVGLLVLYQAAEGVLLTDRTFVIAMFATYGGAVGLLVGRYDADRRARQVRQRAEARRLEEFASVVSHDLRNPLSVAQGRLALAREARDADSDHLGDVAGALDRMDALIEDLLALARAGDAATDREAIELVAAAEAAWGTVETGSATLVIEADGVVSADRGRLRQLLENLFRNTVEHGSTSPSSESREDGDGVTVTVGDLSDRKGFYVADDGPGIPEGEHERVFEAGYSTASEGTGLGLSIVREVADAHGWEVGATESAAGGARFEITGVERS